MPLADGCQHWLHLWKCWEARKNERQPRDPQNPPSAAKEVTGPKPLRSVDIAALEPENLLRSTTMEPDTVTAASSDESGRLDRLCRRITESRKYHIGFTAACALAGAIVSLILQGVLMSAGGSFSWTEFLAIALAFPLALEFSMSFVLDDLFSFLFAGLLSIAIGTLVFFGDARPGSLALPAIAGAYAGSLFCLLTVFCVFDAFKGAIRPLFTVGYYFLFIVLTAASWFLASLVDELLPEGALWTFAPPALWLLGVSWIVFSVNGLTGIRSLLVIRVFLVLSAPAVIVVVFLFPPLQLIRSNFSQGATLCASFTVAYLLSFPLNWAGKRQGASAAIEENRKNVRPDMMHTLSGLVWIWSCAMAALAWLFCRRTESLEHFEIVLPAAFLAMSLGLFLLVKALCSRR